MDLGGGVMFLMEDFMEEVGRKRIFEEVARNCIWAGGKLRSTG